jgi:hypothetical protein
MAKAELNITVNLQTAKELLSLFGELLDELDELKKIIPQWNELERKDIFNRIEITMGKLLEFKGIKPTEGK